MGIFVFCFSSLNADNNPQSQLLDEQYIHWVRTLSVLANIIPSTGRFNHLVNRIHQAQRILLDTINVIYITMPDSHKSSRSYRAILPDAERHELAAIGFSEPILFTAQALTRGYVVRGLEIYTSTLRGPAEQLCATFEALRFVFRQNALANEKARGRCLFWNRVTTTTAPEPSYRALWSVLSDFDRAWAAFESKICECHMASMSGARSFTRQTDVRADRNTMKLEPLAEHDMFVTLLSETMLRALERGYVSRDQVARCDPAVIVAVPRLAVVAGLVWMPDMFQVADENADGRRSGFRWFSNHLERLRTIQCAIQALGDSEIELLEWLLAGSGDQATAEKRDAFIQRIFTDVCVVADALQSGPRAKEFLDVLRCAFELNV